MREGFGMRSGNAAALVLSIVLACPAVAEPASSPSAPASAAAAAAKSASRASPATTSQPTPTPATPEQTAPPAQQAAAPASQPAATPAPAPPASVKEEVPAEPGATADAPPAQTATVTTPPSSQSPPAESKTAAPAPDSDSAPAAAEQAPPAPAQPATAATSKPKLIAAKTLFGAAKDPAPLAARSIGTYARGCLAGAKPLAVDGPTWQAMRLSRNRTWGHPDLIALLERYAGDVKQDGWPGLLVGDISQPRGGPMLTGHASHQVGLDADIWFTPMPDHRLSKKERETLAATSMLADDSLSVDPKIWNDTRVKIIKRVASYSTVERVLVHPAIKKALCQAAGTDRAWLNKVRPYWGHFYHFHVRIGCPAGSTACKPQAPIPGDDGCGKDLDDGFKLLTRTPTPRPPGEPPVVAVPAKPKAPVTLDDMPAECRTVLATASDIKLPPPRIAAKPAHKPAPAAPKAASAKPAEKKPAPTKAAAAKTVEKTKKE